MRLLAVLIGYLFGNFMTALIIGHFFLRADPSKVGSGNPGTANVGAVFGKKWGILTCLGDLCKTAAALLVVHFLLPGQINLAYAGLGLILGHCFPAVHKFQGGKGVAVAALVTVTYNWPAGIVTLLIALLLTMIMQNLTVPPLVFMLLYTIFIWLKGGQEAGLIFAAIFLIMTFRFRADLRNFFTGHGKKVDILYSVKKILRKKFKQKSN